MFSQDSVKGNLSLIILSILIDGDKYGYEITKKIYALTEGSLQLKEGSLYPSLHKMEKQGLIEGYWVQQEPGKPGRKYYRITEQGRQTFALEKERWTSYIKILGKIIYGEGYSNI